MRRTDSIVRCSFEPYRASLQKFVTGAVRIGNYTISTALHCMPGFVHQTGRLWTRHAGNRGTRMVVERAVLIARHQRHCDHKIMERRRKFYPFLVRLPTHLSPSATRSKHQRQEKNLFTAAFEILRLRHSRGQLLYVR